MPDRAAAIIVAAGSGTRMGFDKLAASLAGTPVLVRTVAAFLAAESIGSLVIVGPLSRAELLGGITGKPLRFVPGGNTRAESVARGLAEVPAAADLIAVHDGARPLVSPAEIDRVVADARATGASALARRVTETLKRSDECDLSAGGVNRENLWIMETPQVFSSTVLRSAYQEAISKGWETTDEVSVVECHGTRVHFVESRAPNPKITVPADLALAEALLRA